MASKESEWAPLGEHGLEQTLETVARAFPMLSAVDRALFAVAVNAVASMSDKRFKFTFGEPEEGRQP